MIFDEVPQFDFSRRRRRPLFPAPLLPEDEERSALAALARGSMSALRYLGETANKPIRGIFGSANYLAGGPAGGGALNFIPFSDTVGLTDPDKGVGGRELLTTLGAPPRDPRESWWSDPYNWAGLGLEMAVPYPVPRFGPLTKLGKVAQAPAKKMTAIGGKLGAAGAAQKAVKAATEAAEQTVGLSAGGLKGAMAKAAEALKASGGDVEAAKALGGSGYLFGGSPAAHLAEMAAGARTPLGVGLSWSLLDPLLSKTAGIRNLSQKAVLPVTGQASVGETIAQKLPAAAYEAVQYGRGSPIPILRSAFQARVHGVSSGPAQKIIDEQWAHARNFSGGVLNALPHIDRASGELEYLFKDIGKHLDLAGNRSGKASFDELVRYVSQERSTVAGASRLTAAEIRQLFDVPAADIAAAAKADELAGGLGELINQSAGKMLDRSYAVYRELGGRGDELMDRFAAYWPRHVPTGALGGEAALKRKIISPFFASALRRQEALRDVPEGIVLLNRFAVEPVLTRPLRQQKTFAKLGFNLDKGPRTLKGLAVGDTVRAADRGNYGYVTAFNGKEEVLVHFRSPAGTDAYKALPLDLLTKTATPQTGMPIRQMTARQQVEAAANWLALNGHIVPKDAAAVKTMYAMEAVYRPALARWAKRTGAGAEEIAAEIKLALDGLPKGAVHPTTGKVLNNPLPGKITQLLDYFAGISPREGGLFTQSWLADWHAYMEHIAKSISNLHAVHDVLGRLAGSDPAGVSLNEAWQGITTRRGKPALTDRGLETFLRNYAESKGIELAKDAAGGVLPMELNPAMQDLAAKTMVPVETVRAMGGYMRLSDPASEESHAVLKAFDAITSAYKTGWMKWKPNFHVRNLTSGQAINAMHEAPYTMAGYNAELAKVLRVVLGPTKKIDESQLAHFRTYLASGLQESSGGVQFLRDLGEGSEALRTPTTNFWSWMWGGLSTPTGKVERFGKAGAVPEAFSRVFQTGDRAYSAVEFVNRYTPFAAAVEAGFTPAQARALVFKMQFDYGNLSRFSRTTMRRLIPLWGWFSHNLPYQIEQLVSNVGGTQAHLLSALREVQSGGGGYMPSWLQERMGIRVGGPERNATVLRQFGLAIEDFGNVMISGPGGPLNRRTAERFLGNLHPFIGTAYRLMTRRDPYSGRPLQEIRGLLDQPLLDTALMSLPTSTLQTTLMDLAKAEKPISAKAVNFLSGIKLGSYDLERQRLLELRQALADQLAADRRVGKGTYYYTRQPEALPAAEAEGLKVQIGRLDRLGKLMRKMRQQRKLEQEQMR